MVVRTRHRLCYIISAWLTHTTVCSQTRHTNITINPINWWVIPFQKIHSQYHVTLQPIKYIQLQMNILTYTLCIDEISMRSMRIHRKKTRDSRQKFRLLMEDYIILHKDVFRRTSKSLETIFLLHCCAHHNDSGSPCTWKLEVVGRPKSTMERSCRHKKPKQNTNKKPPNKHKPANTKPTRPLQNLSGSHFIFSSK